MAPGVVSAITCDSLAYLPKAGPGQGAISAAAPRDCPRMLRATAPTVPAVNPGQEVTAATRKH